MAKSVNKVFLLGNVGKDPEIRSTPGGTMVATFSLATTDRFKDQQGNWQDKAEWHNIKTFNRTAEIVRDYVQKGSKLYCEGKITTESWDDKETGQKRYRTVIVVFDISLLSGKQEGDSNGGERQQSYAQQSSGGSRNGLAQQQQERWSDTATEISDDDIPF